MTTPTTVSGRPQEMHLGEWPSPMNLRTYSGQSFAFLVARAGTLVFLCVQAASFGNTLLLALAVAAMGIDLAHTALQTRIYLRGQAIRRWVQRLAAGDLEHTIDTTGGDEISMYGRILETLRQSFIRSRRLEAAQRTLSEELRESNEHLKSTLDALKTTQDQIVSQQKLAELGELAAGAAHEIRNPLQFVKNFAESSGVLMVELAEFAAQPDNLTSKDAGAQIAELVGDLSDNMERITHHSERANRIISDMLDLRHDGSQEFHLVDVNQLLVEQTMLVYQAERANNSSFNVDIRKELDAGVGKISAIPRDLGRVFLNIVTNACHAIVEKSKSGEGFQPTLWLKTRRTEEGVEVTIRDNGVGMTPEVMAKVFNPFFTTKGTDKGTGLGLSLAHDVVREHGGTITPESVTGEYTEMKLRIPVVNDASAPRGTT